MLTETMVNYFEYMVDSNKDGVADAGGAGFANKLVLDENGDIKAQYIDSSNNTLTGNYDFVPILEDFIKAHPDFSYRGARAILAVTGSQGIFGYRCNTSYVSTKGNDFYEQEKAGAIAIVEALKAKGYRLACYTYENGKYRDMNSAGITADLQSWWARVRGKEDPNLPVNMDQRLVGQTFMALNGVDLTVHKGEALGIIGCNGAGKSTLLKLLCRVTAPTEGEIDIYGRIASCLL